MTALNPCPSCNRHVRVEETACPFCSAALVSRASLSERLLPRGRLSRAALIAAGATLAGLSACSSSTSGGNDAGTGGTAAAAGTSGGGTNGSAGGGGSATAGTSGTGGQGGAVSVAIYSAAFPPGSVPRN